MEFADVVRRRRMVRDYDPDRPVPAEVRERLLEHAIRAPSAGFSQGWAFLVLETAGGARPVLDGDHRTAAPPDALADPACAGRRC